MNITVDPDEAIKLRALLEPELVPEPAPQGPPMITNRFMENRRWP
jgi:hypothetical protein